MVRQAASYVRQSVTREGSESLDRQVEANVATALRLGIEIVATLVEPPSTSGYQDRGRSRPRFLELLDLIDAGRVDAVVVYAVDRLSRGGGVGFAPLIDVAERRGLDLDRFIATPNGWTSEFEVGLRATMDREESKKNADRMRAIRRREAEKGLPRAGSTRPYGYANDFVTVAAHEADVIRESALRAVSGESLWSIAKSLNGRGDLSSTGRAWSVTTLGTVLRSARVRGQRAHRGKVVGPAVWDAIISTDLAVALDAALEPRKAGGRARSYLLTGLLRCGLCGATLRSHARAGGRRTYGCLKAPGHPGCGKVSIAADSLEDFTAGIVIGLLVLPTTQWNIEEHARQMSTADVAAVRLDVETRRARLIDLATDGLITKAELRDRQRRLDDELKRAAAATSKTMKVNLPTSLPELKVWWDGASVTARAEMCALVIAHITINRSARPRGTTGFDSDRLDVQLRAYSPQKVAERAWR